jgi:hypothetical protein
MLTNVLQFLKTLDWNGTAGSVSADLRRFVYDVFDESMRTGFAQALDTTVPLHILWMDSVHSRSLIVQHDTHTHTQQHEKARFDTILRDRIVEVLVRDSPELRRHIEATFIAHAYIVPPFLSSLCSWHALTERDLCPHQATNGQGGRGHLQELLAHRLRVVLPQGGARPARCYLPPSGSHSRGAPSPR